MVRQRAPEPTALAAGDCLVVDEATSPPASASASSVATPSQRDRLRGTRRLVHDRTVFAVLAMLFLLPATSIAQQRSTHDYTPEELRTHFAKAAAQHRIEKDGRLLTLREKPLMNWGNPARLQEQGSMFVWEDNGRPQAIASIFTYRPPEGGVVCKQELISTSDQSLTSRVTGRIAWSPNKPGVAWTPIEDFQPPAKTASRRLLQMRTLARRFGGILYRPGDAPAHLKLIPQPLHRWKSEEANVTDGALFSLAIGTDPELLLLIEAQGETPEWHYAVVRSHFFGLEARLDGKKIIGFDGIEALLTSQIGEQPWASEPYFLYFEPGPIPEPEALR